MKAKGELKGKHALCVFGVNRALRQSVQHRPRPGNWPGLESKRTCWDPKGGDLCLNRTKPRETWVEVRSDVDVQIAR